MFLNRRFKIALVITLFAFISGCVYIPDVQQGNVIHRKNVQKLRRGMSTEEVRRMLGNPVLENFLADNSLIYVYTYRHNHEKMKEKRLIIDFQNNQLVRYWTDFGDFK